MRQYFRPLLQTGESPNGALHLASSPLWFEHAERLERGKAPSRVAAVDVPDATLLSICGPRSGYAEHPQIMGVLNVTPDSFSDGGQFDDLDAAVARARSMVAEGADILDIGGESTRPGADYIDPLEEIARTVPVIAALRGHGVTTPISIDTRKAQVAQAALQAGATMLNDVSALTHDPEMAQVAAASNAPICLMHAQGDPATMQKDPHYENVLLDVYEHLAERIDAAEAAGIPRSKIIVDPGIGFGKTQAHNLTLLRGLSLFHALGCPILLGVSRKRFIGTITGTDRAEDRMIGSVAIALDAIRQGVQILRVHDIEAHGQALAMWDALYAGKPRPQV